MVSVKRFEAKIYFRTPTKMLQTMSLLYLNNYSTTLILRHCHTLDSQALYFFDAHERKSELKHEAQKGGSREVNEAPHLIKSLVLH